MDLSTLAAAASDLPPASAAAPAAAAAAAAMGQSDACTSGFPVVPRHESCTNQRVCVLFLLCCAFFLGMFMNAGAGVAPSRQICAGEGCKKMRSQCKGSIYKCPPTFLCQTCYDDRRKRIAAAAAAAAAPPAAAAAAAAPPAAAPVQSVPLPTAASAHATRSASSATSSHRSAAAESSAAAAAADAAMDSAEERDAQPLLSRSAPRSSHPSEEEMSDAVAAPSHSTGLALLRDAEICVALRSALHIKGDLQTPLPHEYRSRIAERFIHSRLVVDSHTAAAVLLGAYVRSEVLVLRNFPGAAPPAYDSIAALLTHPPAREECDYSYNARGTRVHYMFKKGWADTPPAQQVRAWWKTINLLPDVGQREALSAGVLWNFVSRRGKSALHLDSGDGTSSQWHGRKLWVLVAVEEAKQHGIEELRSDSMREHPAGTFRLSDWLACATFQWCILNAGDTIVMPRNRLHAVTCVGDTDSISTGQYCLLDGTPPLPAGLLQPKKSRKRKNPPPPSPPRSSSPSPLPMVKRAKSEKTSRHHSSIQRVVAATLIADGQPATTAAAKAGTSVSTARRWSKRLQTTPSANDASRTGRPRSTDALADGAILRASELDHFATGKDIRHQLALPVSDDTVGRRLDAAGLPSRVAARKRHFTEKERKKRLSFCHGYKHWTAEDWEKVIMSDEVTIEGEGRKRHVRVRRPKGHRFDPEYTVHNRIYAPSRHIFACFCSRGPGFCEMYEGKLKGKSLLGLLQRTVKQTADDYYQTDPSKPGHEQWWFLHDNSKPFKSKVVQNWIFNKQINVLEWPPHSPDLNPIENLWPRVHALTDKLHPTTDEALADAFIACWPELPLDIFTNFAQSMPARIAACIEANGNAIKY